MSALLRSVPDSNPNHPNATDEVFLDYAHLPPLVPAGIYSSVFVRHVTAWAFKAPKVYLYFRIVEPGDHYGKELYRAYRAKFINGKGSRGGQVKLRRGGDLFKMLYRILDVRLRPDRVTMSALKAKLFKVSVRVVKADYRQDAIPEGLWYSVIDDVLEVEAQ